MFGTVGWFVDWLLLFGYLAFAVWVWVVDLMLICFLIGFVGALLVWGFVLVFGWLLWLFDFCCVYWFSIASDCVF